MSRFHSAVAFIVPSPFLIKIQCVSVCVRMHVFMGLCLFLHVCVCACGVTAPQD